MMLFSRKCGALGRISTVKYTVCWKKLHMASKMGTTYKTKHTKSSTTQEFMWVSNSCPQP